MSEALSLEETERALIRVGVPKEKARAAALQQLGIQTAATSRSVVEVIVMRQIQWPVKLTLPWSYLVSDNAKYGVLNGKLMLTAGYRMAKGLIRDRAREVLGDPPPEPATIPLSLEAAVWLPDNRIHDVCNFAKCAHDALEGVVYTKDAWLHRIVWYRAGVDVDQPRAALTIRPITP